MKPDVTFSFGKNWKDFLATIDERVIAEAGKDIEDWLGTENIRAKDIVDIGSGSGLSSLCIYHRGCRRLVSFDYDPHSVEATKLLAERARLPDKWEIFQGSILDDALINRLGTFDIVHSWGVLHHTGKMWQAIDNAIRLCAPDGLLFLSIYAGGDQYEKHLALKRRFNAADERTKAEMVRNLLQSTNSYYKPGGSSEGSTRH
ncbi:MAG TPA: class I SAM-dependent methyltransferase, partial [Candidatus Binatia bacterium]|nr:class I SAM-dependent methyltransferase [Candidatus Binatia bacterium]